MKQLHMRSLSPLLLLFALLSAAICTYAQSPGAPWLSVSTLPSASSAVLGQPYLWTQATTANTCPASGAGGSGGSVRALCMTLDGTSWAVVLVLDATTGTLTTPGGLASGAGSGKSGYQLFNGATSGGSGWAVANVAGAAVLYLMPTSSGSSGNALEDVGSVTCPTLPSGAPSTCRQLGWVTPSVGAVPFSLGSLVAPVLGNLTWINQLTATANPAGNELAIVTAGASGNSVHALVQAIPGTTSTVYVAMGLTAVPTISDNFCAGLVLSATGASSGKFLAFYLCHDSTNSPALPFQLVVDEFNNATSYQGNLFTKTLWVSGPYVMFKIVDDGTTNRTFYVSCDGLNFTQVLQHARTTWFTSPTHYGLMINAYGTLAATAPFIHITGSTP